MNTVFIGGSRNVSRLTPMMKERLQNVLASGAYVVVGDANGADKAVQKYLADADYQHVTVFCSGETPRNNLGGWKTHNVVPPKNTTGFEFYAVKDREMALRADYGLMVWDGKSPGTILNLLRLIKAGKKAVLVNAHDKTTRNFKVRDDWEQFFSSVSDSLRDDLRKRATDEEWEFASPKDQPSFFDPAPAIGIAATTGVSREEAEATLNEALASGNPAAVVDALGSVAKKKGMSQVAKETGLARESLYRSLSAGGNPEFSTVWKVIASMGLRLVVGKALPER